jgi:hypothetical protein
MSDPMMVAKIRALLAKAESTEFPDEADAFMGKAQALILKHHIEQSELAPEARDGVIVVSIPLDASRVNLALWIAVAETNSVAFLTMRGNGANTGILTGFPADISFVQSLYASLVFQREAALFRAYRPLFINAKSFNHSFRAGYAQRVADRLVAARRRNVAESQPGTDLVLADVRSRVEAKVADAFPDAGEIDPIKVTSAAGVLSGDLAAGRADVSGGRNNLGGTREAVTA